MKVKLFLFRADKCDKKVLIGLLSSAPELGGIFGQVVISLAFISDWHPGPRMSASDQMRAMLDQLMGTQRNGESWNPSSNVVLVIFNMITDVFSKRIPLNANLSETIYLFVTYLASFSLFVHIGPNNVPNVKFYFSRPDDILWKIRILAVVCKIFNTQPSLFPGLQETQTFFSFICKRLNPSSLLVLGIEQKALS